MLDATVTKLLNEQITHEFFSAYLYLDFANYYVDHHLDGFAAWYNVQAQEERDHALLFVQYLQNNDMSVTLDAIPKPEMKLDSPQAPLEASLSHEQHVTHLIHTIYDAAYTIKDFRTMQFLDWFVKEQGEEENTADTMLERYKLFGADPKGLYLLDQELGARTYAPPTLTL